MKKGCSFITALLLVFFLTNPVWATESDSDLPGFSSPDTGNVQLLFAKMQMEVSETVNQQTSVILEEIEIAQNEQKLVASYLNSARQLQSEADSNSDGLSEMPADLADYMDENGLDYDRSRDDLLMSGEEWETTISSLEGHLEQLGVQTQQLMVYMQDFLAQYNSQQGGNTQNLNNNQTLTSLARGQSMYGDSDAGMMITIFVVGLVLGCVMTVGVQRMKKRDEQR